MGDEKKAGSPGADGGELLLSDEEFVKLALMADDTPETPAVDQLRAERTWQALEKRLQESSTTETRQGDPSATVDGRQQWVEKRGRKSSKPLWMMPVLLAAAAVLVFVVVKSPVNTGVDEMTMKGSDGPRFAAVKAWDRRQNGQVEVEIQPFDAREFAFVGLSDEKIEVLAKASHADDSGFSTAFSVALGMGRICLVSASSPNELSMLLDNIAELWPGLSQCSDAPPAP